LMSTCTSSRGRSRCSGPEFRSGGQLGQPRHSRAGPGERRAAAGHDPMHRRRRQPTMPARSQPPVPSQLQHLPLDVLGGSGRAGSADGPRTVQTDPVPLPDSGATLCSRSPGEPDAAASCAAAGPDMNRCTSSYGPCTVSYGSGLPRRDLRRGGSDPDSLRAEVSSLMNPPRRPRVGGNYSSSHTILSVPHRPELFGSAVLAVA